MKNLNNKLKMGGDSQQFYDATKAWLAIILILHLLYVVANTFRFIKTKFLTEKVDVFPFIPALTKSLEIDLMPTIWIMCMVIAMGAFFGFMAFLGYVLLFVILPVFIFARVKEQMIVLKIAKFINIGIGIISFLDMFINDLEFSA